MSPTGVLIVADHATLLQAHDALRAEHDALLHQHQELRLSHDELARQVEWFKRQIFGSKSERRIFAPNGEQLTLGDLLRAETASVSAPEIQVPAHRRRTRSGSSAEEPSQDLRFDPSVPVE
ncbi:MAG: hypothetical protein IT349_07785, partial [Candidatus Eisenbacteria bacterium]|nr:hypothetical protein [Candidatus Eisenbacteria bacterium]